MRALQELHPNWVFCHESAALAFGLPVPFERIDAVHVVTSQSNRNASSGTIRWHIVRDDEFTTVQGLRVTSITRTVYDCMRTAHFKQALAVADGALRLTGERPTRSSHDSSAWAAGMPACDTRSGRCTTPTRTAKARENPSRAPR